MTLRRLDAVVLGLGAMGSAALWRLAVRGASVAGVEQFAPGHSWGSSHGGSRIIRKAYFEHPDYVPLLEGAYRLWRTVEATSGRHVFDEGVGLLLCGPAGGAVVGPTLECAERHGLPIRRLTPAEARDLVPPLAVPDGLDSLWDPDGGILRPEEAVRAQVELAVRAGAEAREGEEAIGIRREAGGIVVTTTKGELRADKLVATAGAWSAGLLPRLDLPLELRRKVVFWHRPTGDERPFALGCLPTFYLELPYGSIYGFPDLDGRGVKLADHAGGQWMASPSPVRSLLPGDETSCRKAVAACLPGLRPGAERHEVCLYTLTPDQNFIIDLHPDDPDIALAAGFSGHGFKFAPIIGEVLADLALLGRTDHPVGFLSLRRFRDS